MNGKARCRWTVASLLGLAWLAWSSGAAVGGESQRDMMRRNLSAEAQRASERRRTEYDGRSSAQQIDEYQQQTRQWMLQVLGGLPERTPLNAQVTGRVEKPGYGVEKIIFESQPSHFVTAAMFIPDARKYPPPWPAVLVPCGHAEAGKAYDPYQRACALLAVNGIAALIFDPIDQGERLQMIDTQGKPKSPGGTFGHSRVGIGSILLGRNTARFMVWDGVRALDYLASRPDVDPRRLGCMGNSGGGTQTAYLTALDTRIAVSSPSCYITSFDRLLPTVGPQDLEQNLFGQLARGVDHADYLMLAAPRPTLICAATRDFFDIHGTWSAFREAKRFYGGLGFPERVDLAENDDVHGYTQPLRQAAVQWMRRWLGGVDEPVVEPPDLPVLSAEEMRATPRNQVMLMPGARSVYDLNDDYEAALVSRRAALWSGPDRAEAMAAVRRVTGIRPLAELSEPRIESRGMTNGDGCTIEELEIYPEPGIVLPALLYKPMDGEPAGGLLAMHAAGKSDPELQREVLAHVGRGLMVLAVDLRGTGETRPAAADFHSPQFGSDGRDIMMAYLLGRSYIAMRAEDLLACARVLKTRSATGTEPIDLLAMGHVCQPALHAAALEPGLFGRVRLVGPLDSWSTVVRKRLYADQLVNLVHGALEVYDLPNLRAALGDQLTVEPAPADK